MRNMSSAPRPLLNVVATLVALAPCALFGPAHAAECLRKDALGTSRVLEVDPATYPRVGLKSFPQTLPLRDGEVVLTFDDGPWPGNTPAVLKALADECTTGIFFPIGKHATYHPEILRQVYAAGHTVGSHTWSHENLNNKKLTEDQKKDEIERGLAAVKWAPKERRRSLAAEHRADTEARHREGRL